MNNPLVSIIIPTYNRAHFIGETLESVVAQTYQNWECIVIDDGSSDYTDELMEFYCEKDARIHYHHRSSHKPKGANACRNYGFDLSKGEYINWFDSDDLMFSTFLEKKMILFLESKKIEIVFSGFEVYSSTNKYSKIYELDIHDKLIDIALYRNIKLNTHSFLYKRELIVNFKFDEHLTRAQDLDFVFRVISAHPYLNWNVYCFPLYRIIQHSNSISDRFRNLKHSDFISEHKVWMRIKDFYEKESDKINYSLSLKRIYFLRLSCLKSNHIRLYLYSIFSSKIIGKMDGLLIIYFLFHSISGKGTNRMNKIIRKSI